MRGGDGGPLGVMADPTQLAVALRALCQNALEALGGQGHIRIELGRRAGDVEIRVRDDGPGIPPGQRRHIFDPFYSARQAGRGLGLGLSKCWRIITNHGGRIAVEDQPGGGGLLSHHAAAARASRRVSQRAAGFIPAVGGARNRGD